MHLERSSIEDSERKDVEGERGLAEVRGGKVVLEICTDIRGESLIYEDQTELVSKVELVEIGRRGSLG